MISYLPSLEIIVEDQRKRRNEFACIHGLAHVDLDSRSCLSPEDLTESEWFYLMCVSFSFPTGVRLPGKAYGRRQHVWLAGANEVDSKTFSRAILAKVLTI